ncbi:Sodium/calcium exchanger protein-domain-containing protein [Armillaria luteobubalina]|uniref:Sodium/calcium exchanger protein-domain-containing protein n=1 Tax=Armillaria luteobubalina TaxID=153913 RepID=A0AA39TTX6_9AGAR|nr:Sodium/calcium exchanger protein-domain-containing protein [Armillaria luteobubalina]
MDTSSGSNAGTNTPLITIPPLMKHSATCRNRKATGDTVNRTDSRRSFSLARATTLILQPSKEVGPSPGVWQSIKSILLASWFNLFLLFIPVSWALHFAFAGEKDTVIFVCSYLAIIPLAKLLAFATDELSLRVGLALAGLLNATLGNTVELIIAIISLAKCELQIVQSSLVGSILINLLLVLGMSFFAGGIHYQEQGFGHMATQLHSSLLAISVIAVLLPAAFHFSLVNNTQNDETSDILNVSHGTSIILLFIYISYLVFQLFSHASLYADYDEGRAKSTRYPAKKEKAGSETPKTGTVSSATSTAIYRSADNRDIECGTPDLKEEETEYPKLSVSVTVGLLIVVTVLVTVTVKWLVDSVDGLAQSRHISKEFVGVIILPFVCRTPDGATIVTPSVKDKLNLSVGITVGSSIQIVLSVTPFIVLLGWVMDKPLTLLFDPYESIAMFLAVLTVNYVVQDGKSNWLEGMILICLYVILCVTFWYYPGNNPFGSLLESCT